MIDCSYVHLPFNKLSSRLKILYTCLLNSHSMTYSIYHIAYSLPCYNNNSKKY